MVNPIPEFPDMRVFFGLLGAILVTLVIAIAISKRSQRLTGNGD